jgi:cytochrome c oxidase subunit 4
MAHDTTHSHALDYQSHEDDHAHGTRVYWIVFIALMVLLLLTVWVAFFNLGPFNVPVAFTIASLKALLILWFFMHLNESTRLVQVFAFASFAWLAIFMIMITGDYVTRHILPRADERTVIRKVDSFEAQSGLRSNKLAGPGDPGQEDVHGAAPEAPAVTRPAGQGGQGG